MIIFGTRGVTYSKEKGDFHCPSCATPRPYDHKRVRRFFTLYFIPLIPLDLHGEYIECQQCRNTFKMDVLEYDPEAGAAAFEAEFHAAIKRVMVEMMLADGVVDDEEVAVIREVYGKLAGTDITEDDIRREIVEAETRTRDVTAALTDLVGHLNDHGKEMVVRAAFMVAAADGEFQEEEQALLGDIGKALEMSSAHVNGVLATMVEQP